MHIKAPTLTAVTVVINYRKLERRHWYEELCTTPRLGKAVLPEPKTQSDSMPFRKQYLKVRIPNHVRAKRALMTRFHGIRF